MRMIIGATMIAIIGKGATEERVAEVESMGAMQAGAEEVIDE
jgi:hypothetical protein